MSASESTDIAPRQPGGGGSERPRHRVASHSCWTGRTAPPSVRSLDSPLSGKDCGGQRTARTEPMKFTRKHRLSHTELDARYLND